MSDSPDISDGICAYLQGGLGNQLFILAAAWAQADRLNCPLYVDYSRFLGPDPLERAKETPRHFELYGMNFPGTILAEESPWFRNSPRRPAAIRRPGSGSRKLKVYRQPTLNYHEDIEQVTPGTTLLGYFQSWRYFDRIADRMADSLLGASLAADETAALETLTDSPTITAHVRRGDYLTPAAAFHHGIASADYFVRAIGLIRRLEDSGMPVRVYSDSPEIARDELSGVENLMFLEQTERLGSLATILAMSRGNAFAMSNSSFSWWAAWLLARRSPDAAVVAPRPWLADGQSGHDQLLPRWMTLDAR